MSKLTDIACVGMTHLGLVHSAAFADQGFNLICYDESKDCIQRLQKGELPVNEPGLDELIHKNKDRFLFTDSIDDLKNCKLIFVACDVPTDDHGESDLSIIHHLVGLVKSVFSEDSALVVLSQVPPGFTRKIDLPLDSVFYQVETLIFGNAVARALYPERYIIGMSEVEKPLPDLYLKLLSSFNCPVLKMRYESAELAKISINMFLVSSVTTTNTLAEICEAIGADWEEIIPALRLDKRIGQYAYLKPGLGIAGGNLERDLNTIIKLGEQYKTDTKIVSSWLSNSQHRRDWVLRCFQQEVLSMNQDPLICVLGLAYKENTHSTKNSPSIALLKKLHGFRIKSHDPVVTDHLTHAEQQSDVESAIKDADVVIIMTPWDDYRKLSLSFIRQHMKGGVVIDPYQVLVFDAAKNTEISYFSLGKKTIKELEYVET